MNTKIRTTLLGGLLSASIAAPALAGDYSTPIPMTAPESADMFSFSAGYHSTYVFRGADFGDDMVDWSLEASKTFGCFDLTAGVWQANVISNSAPGDLETDFYLGASRDLGFASLDFGYTFYYFEGATAANTQEVYIGLTKEMAGIEFSATYVYDFDFIEASYFELGASKSLTFAGQGFDASLVLGFNIDDTELSHVQPTISKSFDLNSEVSVTPYLSYSFAIEDFDYAGNALDDEFVAGISLGFSF
jgi:uncharacterized protein (TIGR02001 family)